MHCVLSITQETSFCVWPNIESTPRFERIERATILVLSENQTAGCRLQISIFFFRHGNYKVQNQEGRIWMAFDGK